MFVKEDPAGCGRRARVRLACKRACNRTGTPRSAPGSSIEASAQSVRRFPNRSSHTAQVKPRRDRGFNAPGLVGCVLLILTLPLATCLMTIGTTSGQDVTAVGGWTETVDATDLQSGAGSDLAPTYESAAGATVISVTYGGSWRVDVRRTDGTWHADFSLHTERTSDGTGSGTISGGTTYTEITGVDTEFFSGTQDRTDIDARYQLTGMSISAAPGTYNTTVTLTIVSTD